jgi:hypothetical protein
MELELELPEECGDVAFTISPLEPAPDDPRAWLEAAVGARFAIAARRAGETAAGWPLELLEVELAGGAVRLVAVYRFCEWVGLAVAAAADRATLRERATPVLETGRPVWRGRAGVAAIAELFS